MGIIARWGPRRDPVLRTACPVRVAAGRAHPAGGGRFQGARRNGHRDQRLPNTSSISFEYVEGESILLKLSDRGICASSGSACTSGSLEPSHVLRAMGVPFTAAHGSIRFSLSSYNTEEEVDFILKVMPPIIEELRAISPFWDGSVARSCTPS